MSPALTFALAPLLAALLLPLLRRILPGSASWIAIAVAGLLFLLAISLVPAVRAGEVIAFSVPWVPEFGANLSFTIDGLAIFFTLLITGIGFLIFVYSHKYMAHEEHRFKFYCWMLVFMGAMLGLVTASNLMVLYLFWELTTVSSFFLIGLKDRAEDSRFNATMAAMVTTAGSLAMLAGMVLLFQVAGTLELAELFARSEEIRQDPLVTPIVALLLLGAFTKSALLPFHIWLPGAMVAPTPVSAYLHSATMVKAGVFLVARLTPIFQGVPEWVVPTFSLGMATMVVAGVIALRQHDLKALLAFSTVSQLGLMIATYGLGTHLAITAATVHVLTHATFKGAMFLVAGIVEHETHTRDLRALGGLAKGMGLTATFATLAALSSGGIAPLSGFVSKELLFETMLDIEGLAGLAAVVVLVAGSAITLAYSIRYAHGTFFAPPAGEGRRVHEAPAILLISPGILAFASLFFGIYPAFMAGFAVSPAVQAIAQETVDVRLALWHGFNLPLLVSLAGISIGVLIFAAQRRLIGPIGTVTGRYTVLKGYALFTRFMYDGLPRAYWYLQNGHLTTYIYVIFISVTALLALALTRTGVGLRTPEVVFTSLGVLEYILALLLISGALAIIWQRNSLAAMLSTAIVGLFVVGVFVLYSAPDLAFTQLLVEFLLSVIFVLGLRHMLGLANVRFPRSTVAIQAAVAVAAGVGSTILVLTVLQNQLYPSIADFYVQNAEAAGGRNIVNIILVNFRAFDTLGEIVVVGIAATATYFIMRFQRDRVS